MVAIRRVLSVSIHAAHLTPAPSRGCFLSHLGFLVLHDRRCSTIRLTTRVCGRRPAAYQPIDRHERSTRAGSIGATFSIRWYERRTSDVVAGKIPQIRVVPDTTCGTRPISGARHR